jgi:hypothetical protein
MLTLTRPESIAQGRATFFCKSFQDGFGGEALNRRALDYDQEGLDLDAHQAAAVDGIQLGIVHAGNFDLTLRETFNKIIHATDTRLDWNHGDSYEWWSGKVWLSGSMRGSLGNWSLMLRHLLLEQLG